MALIDVVKGKSLRKPAVAEMSFYQLLLSASMQTHIIFPAKVPNKWFLNYLIIYKLQQCQ